jgi:hypothetical protein
MDGASGNATANTGSGAGGAGTPYNQATKKSGNGGSGIVIIRYSNTFPLPTSTTGTVTSYNTGGYRYLKWTGSGSVTF